MPGAYSAACRSTAWSSPTDETEGSRVEKVLEGMLYQPTASHIQGSVLHTKLARCFHSLPIGSHTAADLQD
jgi:hypothetical protein